MLSSLQKIIISNLIISVFFCHVSKWEQCVYAVLFGTSHCSYSLQHLHELSTKESWGITADPLYWLAHAAIAVCSHVLSMYKEIIWQKRRTLWPFVSLSRSDGEVEQPWSMLNSSSEDILFPYNIKKIKQKTKQNKKALLWRVWQRQQPKIFKTCISARYWLQVVKSSSQTDGGSELRDSVLKIL